MKNIGIGIRFFCVMTLLVGIFYPCLMTVVGQGLFQEKANGGVIVHQEKTIGAHLIGQKFVQEKYFWPRPSAIDYQPLPSGGTNLGPTSLVLKKKVDERVILFQKFSMEPIPPELLFTSGSGLDPHISVQGALFQVPRVVRARNFSEPQALFQLIQDLKESPTFGFLGEERVNVLELNLALDQKGKGQTP
ncbi:MAG: potassium-transporting ATPase subunit KdpC [Deltaproteobacteria bacterium]|nr:potassium-transporting ATPase subunit KdpC [Deltaproteobacteria bacterium]